MQYAPIDRVVNDPSLVEDDPIIAPLLREQLEPMLGGRRDGGVGGPERALMRAMLQDAVLCLLGAAAPEKDRARLATDARYWVMSRSREWVFSFESVCDALDIDSDYARRRLLKMAEQHATADTPAAQADEGQRRDGCAVRGMRGLRKGGSRPRRAIHFMVERRRRKVAAEN
jgi:hypothetical protein